MQLITNWVTQAPLGLLVIATIGPFRVTFMIRRALMNHNGFVFQSTQIWILCIKMGMLLSCEYSLMRVWEHLSINFLVII